MADFLERTEQTKLRRERPRGCFDRQTIYAILDATPLCHFGYVVDGKPKVTPTLHWREGDRLFWHGSVASQALLASNRGDVCVTVTLFDGIVLARSGFLHSANYQSVMVFGNAEAVEDSDAKYDHLKTFVDGLFPERWETLRPVTDRELNATTVLSLPIKEASAKIRRGGPSDPEADRELPIWAGVIPIHQTVGTPVADTQIPDGVDQPTHVTEFSLGQTNKHDC